METMLNWLLIRRQSWWGQEGKSKTHNSPPILGSGPLASTCRLELKMSEMAELGGRGAVYQIAHFEKLLHCRVQTLVWTQNALHAVKFEGSSWSGASEQISQKKLWEVENLSVLHKWYRCSLTRDFICDGRLPSLSVEGCWTIPVKSCNILMKWCRLQRQPCN